MRAILTQKSANFRFNSVEPGIIYRLYLNLQKGDKFDGLSHYTFNLKQVDNVFLDFCGKSVNSLELNGFQMDPTRIAELWKNGVLTLPSEHLHTNQSNNVIITFSNQYYHDGNGIHTFIDVDGSQYTYCQSEPFWINKVYPVFDQPDLKGRMSFVIQAPSDWSVISNMNPITVTLLANYGASAEGKSEFGQKILSLLPGNFENQTQESLVHTFNETPLLSTYLFNFVSGPFDSIVYDGCDGETIPMTIYCRKSHKIYANEQKREIFLYCKLGIEFFNSFFKTAYPFEKYDFIFCPEFTVGAMEYPGAITFSDMLMYTQKPTANQTTNRGRVIVHELAHMWFGNLVTMKWWNDLWLNESFADFACYVAMDGFQNKLPFPHSDSMTSFLLRKFWGYTEDQLITTHPISCEVPSTLKADSIFDGITYAKGAACLKQLLFILGYEQFSTNLGRYFAKYQWKNANLAEFLEEMKQQDLSPENKQIDMADWNHEWIETAGLNRIQGVWDPQQQGNSELVIRQFAVSPQHPTLRNHKIKVAFFNADATVGEVLTINLPNQETTIVSFVNRGYKAVLLNYEDWDFVKIEVDAHSLEFFKQNFTKLESWLNKLLILRALYEMVRDAKLKSTDFVSIFNHNFIKHLGESSMVCEIVLSFISAAIDEFTPPKLRKGLRAQMFDMYMDLLLDEDRPDILKIYKSNLLYFAKSGQQAEILRGIYEKTHPLHPKLIFSKEEKWTLFFKLQKSDLLTDVQKKIYENHFSAEDQTDSKKYNILRLEALRASDEKLVELWTQVASVDRKISYTEMKYLLIGLVDRIEKKPDNGEYQDKYCEVLLYLIDNDQLINAKTFMNNARVYVNDDALWITKLNSVLEKLGNKNEFFEIQLKKTIDNLQRKLRAFAIHAND